MYFTMEVSGLLEELHPENKQLQLQITLKVGITTEQAAIIDNTSGSNRVTIVSFKVKRVMKKSAATSTKITYD
jgi:hypothetical protein